jgi:hypothetical protein
MDHAEAVSTLDEVARVRRSTRRAVHPVWFSNVVAGAFFSGSAAVMALDAGEGVSLAYWIGAGLLGLALIVRHAVRAERELGVESKPADPTLGILAAIVAAAILLDGDVVMFVAAAGTLAVGLLLRDRLEIAAGLAIAAVGAAILAVDPGEPWLWGNLGLGLALLAAGLAGARSARA